MDACVQMIRRYVTDFVNRHDFSVLPDIMIEDYALSTSGVFVAGRDDQYSKAVARQFQQFPGLVFTLHEIVPCGDHVALRFTEHGASIRHDGRCAAWESIGIYRLEGGRLARCDIEQDYFSRRRQLETATPMAVDPPAAAPWDAQRLPADPAAEAVVRRWLASAAWTRTNQVEFDDQRATGLVEQILDQDEMEISLLVSGGDRVAFHACQRGRLNGDFARELSPPKGAANFIHLAGIVSVGGGEVVGGHVVRDRWGLYRRITPAPAAP